MGGGGSICAPRPTFSPPKGKHPTQETIRVHVVDKGRSRLCMRYRCPVMGKEEPCSTGTNKQKEAAKIAAKWEAELQEGRYQRTSRMGWDEFRLAWENAKLHDLRPSTMNNYSAALNTFERIIKPDRVGRLNSAAVAEYKAKLRGPQKKKLKSGRVVTIELSEASVARHLRHLKAVTRWAVRQGILPVAPIFDMPKKATAQRMKGRPVTGEEFDRMLDAVEKEVGPIATASWKLLLLGLWWSGLRLREAIALRWDHQPGGVSVRLAGHGSVLVFDGEAQKSGKSEVVPLAPEVVQLLEPIRRDTGYVFRPLTADGTPKTRKRDEIGRVISKIGKKAGIVTNAEKGRTATAHDLRRSFRTRWGKRVMPTQLCRLMRHSTPDTTLAFYVQFDAAESARELWAVAGDTLGDTPTPKEEAEARKP